MTNPCIPVSARTTSRANVPESAGSINARRNPPSISSHHPPSDNCQFVFTAGANPRSAHSSTPGFLADHTSTKPDVSHLLTATSTDDFDDLCLDLARSPALLQALRTRSSTELASESTTCKSDILKTIGPIYRSLSLSDPKLTGHPIRYRSKHFSISPRGLRVGDCEFLNLPPGEGVNLTTRAGVDGRPAFVLEFVTTLFDVDDGRATWIGASQVEATACIWDMAIAVLKAREARMKLRRDAAMEEEKRLRRTKEQLMVFPDAIALMDDSKYFSDSDYDDSDDQDNSVRSVSNKLSNLMFNAPRGSQRESLNQHDNVRLSPATTEDSKYFSSSSDSESESECSSNSPRISTPATSPSPNRTSLASLTSHPNYPFLFHSPSLSASFNTTPTNPSPAARQVSPSNHTDDPKEDIWRSIAYTYARPDFHFRSTQTTRSKPLTSHTIPNNPADSIPLPSLLHFHRVLATLRTLHYDTFLLKVHNDTTIHDLTYIITHVSASLRRTPSDVQAAFKTSHEQTKQMIRAALKRGEEARMSVNWGTKGVKKWIHLVPLVMGGRAGSVDAGKREKWWMGFLTDGEGGSGVWAR